MLPRWQPPSRCPLRFSDSLVRQAAGVLGAALVSPALVPLAEAAGLRCALNLRGRFAGWNSTGDGWCCLAMPLISLLLVSFLGMSTAALT